MSLRRSARLRARAFPLTELSSDLQRHVASFLGPTDLMSLSGSSRGLMTSLANQRAHAQEPWTAIRPLVEEIRRSAALAKRLARRLPASRLEARRMAIAEGLTFGNAGWKQARIERSFFIELDRTVTGRDGATVKLWAKVIYPYGDDDVEMQGTLDYAKGNEECDVTWGKNGNGLHSVNVFKNSSSPALTDALVTNVVRALRTSGFPVRRPRAFAVAQL